MRMRLVFCLFIATIVLQQLSFYSSYCPTHVIISKFEKNPHLPKKPLVGST